MACRDFSNRSEEWKERQRANRRADREWELAGLARRDGDKKAEAEHTEKARLIQRGEE